ncbi:uncharacterized protein CcaverHIS019_0103270 [Cutaneotrichosporon cavernicola]|uniref:Protein kinase domain-containing protein n=1 Tax=Cutaneotrichosporon cavernicola TaxID=279322 RepID=A0AA48HY15_9TREE|nr:uncharacterized protein CcaverHIS019_0103270 [Cutaneotrichosporon cavernicola]BEI87609.1 hypothetical protein CcaverHIS019_0103270 [Cutaneotrichosporon cavernicola]
MSIQCFSTKPSVEPGRPLSKMPQARRAVVALPRRRALVYKATDAIVVGPRSRAVSLPPSSPPAVLVPVSRPSPVLHENCDVDLGDRITLSLPTSFGGVPVIDHVDFYKADTYTFRHNYEQLWHVLCSSGPTDCEYLDADDDLDGEAVEDVEDELYELDDEQDPEDILEVLLPTRHNVSVRNATLSLHTYLLSGRIFAAFAGTVSYTTQCGVHSTTLVAKIHRPTTHTVSQLYETAAEATIYARMPDGIAPRFHGLFVKMAGERMVTSILEYAGTPIATTRAARALRCDYKEAIVRLYNSLHEAGIIHVSCTPKHWLCADGCFRLIDFGCRWVRDGAPVGRVIEPSAFTFQAAEEMAKVRRTLGLPVWAKS